MGVSDPRFERTPLALLSGPSFDLGALTVWMYSNDHDG